MNNFFEPEPASNWPNGKQRTVPRFSMLAIAELADTDGTVCIVGRMSEVSSKGCYVNTPSTLALNSGLKVVISRDDETFLTDGKVIYRVEDDIPVMLADEGIGTLQLNGFPA